LLNSSAILLGGDTLLESRHKGPVGINQELDEKLNEKRFLITDFILAKKKNYTNNSLFSFTE